jgi:hypothetical protein
MSDNVSLRIVNFLIGLPQFHYDTFEGKEAARRITDGTVFVAPEDSELCEDGLLIAYWQGNPERYSESLIGRSIAGIEIAEGVQLWVAMGQYTDYKTVYMQMAHHFTVKTGETIDCGYEIESELMTLISKAARKIGSEALISVIKAGTGMP